MRWIWLILQWVAMLCVLTPIELLRRPVKFVDRGLANCSRFVFLRLYYPTCVLRRRAAGEDEWKEIDLNYGIWPPEGHPYWAKIPRLDDPRNWQPAPQAPDQEDQAS